MKPTIGRIVIYHPSVTRGDSVDMNGSPRDVPAIIVAVHSDTYINLKVFGDGPNTTWVTSVTQGLGERQWSWPERA